MNAIEKVRQDIQTHESIKNRIGELTDQIREFKRDYEANRAEILCDIVDGSTSIDDVLKLRTKYESCSQTLTTLEEAREYISSKLNVLREQLSAMSSGVASQRTKDEFKVLVEKLGNDKFNSRLKVQFIQHCMDYMGMNKREAYEELDKVLDPRPKVIHKASE